MKGSNPLTDLRRIYSDNQATGEICDFHSKRMEVCLTLDRKMSFEGNTVGGLLTVPPSTNDSHVEQPGIIFEPNLRM